MGTVGCSVGCSGAFSSGFGFAGFEETSGQKASCHRQASGANKLDQHFVGGAVVSALGDVPQRVGHVVDSADGGLLFLAQLGACRLLGIFVTI